MGERKRFALQVDLHLSGVVVVESEDTEETAFYNAVQAVKEQLAVDGVEGLDGCWHRTHLGRDGVEVEQSRWYSQDEADAVPEEHLDINWKPEE